MSAGKRLLVIDDDESIRHFIELAFGDEGYDVRGAADAHAALELLDQWPPHVILLDMRMPGMDGHGFAEQYRSRPGPRAPLVVLTAARDAAASARQVEADAWLAKPFDLVELIEIVARLAGD